MKAHSVQTDILHDFNDVAREIREWCTDWKFVLDGEPSEWVISRVNLTLPWWKRGKPSPEVIALMKRAKGVTLAEIMEATGWQKHIVRGFVSILGSKGGEEVESSKNAAGERSYRIAK
jgi:hypothetical protein